MLKIDFRSDGTYSSRQILLVDNLLSPQHADHLNKSAISREVVKRRGYRTVCADSPALEAFAPRQRRAGILMPLWGVGGEQVGVMLRPDEPRVVSNIDTGKSRTIKYEFPKGEKKRLDVPPTCRGIRDKTVPLWITEGVKKADSLASAGKCVVMCDGVWAWKSEGVALGDWEGIPLKGREIILCFDSDAWSNKQVAKALNTLTRWLSSKGGEVVQVVLPTVNDDPKTGVDDYLAAHSVEDLDWVVEQSRVMKSQRSSQASKTTEYAQMLEKMGLSFRYNEITMALELNGEEFHKFHRVAIRNRLRDEGYTKHLTAIEETWQEIAFKNRYNPIVDYLRSLKWDGQDHINRLCSYFEETMTINNGTSSPLRLFLRKWMIGSVAKILMDSPVRNPMLVLDCEQNIGKSYFCRWMCPLDEFFADGQINPDDKDYRLKLGRIWLWEVGELGATTRKRDRESLKDFLTKQVVDDRPAYGENSVRIRPITSFIGTINNEDGYLNDPTGSTRFMTVGIRGLDWAYSQEIDKHQLWAQAVALFDKGETWQLSTQEAKIRDEMNSMYEVENVITSLIAEKYEKVAETDNPLYYTTLDIMRAIGIDPTKSQMTKVGIALKEFGAKKTRKSVDGKRVWVYEGIKEIV